MGAAVIQRQQQNSSAPLARARESLVRKTNERRGGLTAAPAMGNIVGRPLPGRGRPSLDIRPGRPTASVTVRGVIAGAASARPLRSRGRALPIEGGSRDQAASRPNVSARRCKLSKVAPPPQPGSIIPLRSRPPPRLWRVPSWTLRGCPGDGGGGALGFWWVGSFARGAFGGALWLSCGVCVGGGVGLGCVLGACVLSVWRSLRRASVVIGAPGVGPGCLGFRGVRRRLGWRFTPVCFRVSAADRPGGPPASLNRGAPRRPPLIQYRRRRLRRGPVHPSSRSSPFH